MIHFCADILHPHIFNSYILTVLYIYNRFYTIHSIAKEDGRRGMAFYLNIPTLLHLQCVTLSHFLNSAKRTSQILPIGVTNWDAGEHPSEKTSCK